LEGGARVKRMRAAARIFAEANLRMDTYLNNFENLIHNLTAPPVRTKSARRLR
jgi:hypothetical protein